MCWIYNIPIVENTFKAQLAIFSFGGFTYFGFSKVSTIPLKHTKISCLKPMVVYNTLIKDVANILIVPLLMCFNEKDQIPCNTFILFFLYRFCLLGVHWSGNQVGRCNHVGGVW
jgi:hypothetical protein